MFVYSFEKMEAWQMTVLTIKKLYAVTKAFPSDEKFGLTLQMRRAAVSIASNLAEGSGRTSSKDQVRFYRISFGSALELVCQLQVAKELNYFSEEQFRILRSDIERITRMINQLCKT